jgi:hypothetical protein
MTEEEAQDMLLGKTQVDYWLPILARALRRGAEIRLSIGCLATIGKGTELCILLLSEDFHE